MHNLILSWVRTAVPAAVGGLAAWLGVKGLHVAPDDVLAVGTSVGASATVAYQVVVSTLQRRWPIVGVLLGSTRVPTYAESSHPGVHSDRDLRGL
ncbi:hypothetical protein ITP53_39325 [Nonomuraea sp. K274]|uniref:Uncharacterized protein n=1 Tax=Nonomuraea cypriaca TaxID=1187855 RepID=A0A931F2L1_9ACTN|nr:hypothetical protein [Nonomuraea cypriaca]MBF8191645.1 hypothetical protein [Nonomuraea cypriaca]